MGQIEVIRIMQDGKKRNAKEIRELVGTNLSTTNIVCVKLVKRGVLKRVKSKEYNHGRGMWIYELVKDD